MEGEGEEKKKKGDRINNSTDFIYCLHSPDNIETDNNNSR